MKQQMKSQIVNFQYADPTFLFLTRRERVKKRVKKQSHPSRDDIVMRCSFAFLTGISVIMGINRDLHSISCKTRRRGKSKVTRDSVVTVKPGQIFGFGLNNIQ